MLNPSTVQWGPVDSCIFNSQQCCRALLVSFTLRLSFCLSVRLSVDLSLCRSVCASVTLDSSTCRFIELVAAEGNIEINY